MFLLNNYNSDKVPNIEKKNKKHFLSLDCGSFEIVGVEKKTPVQFVCTTDFVNYEECIFIDCYKKVEDNFEKVQVENTTVKAKPKLVPKPVSMDFTVENQLLPVYNKDAVTYKDIYDINDIFDLNVLDELRSVQYDRHEFSTDNNLHNAILDCLYKVLTRSVISKSNLGQYAFFYNQLDLNNFKLSKLGKDKLITLFYIVLLIAHNYEYDMERLPKFGLPSAKYSTILRGLGCTLGKKILLKNVPKEYSMNIRK